MDIFLQLKQFVLVNRDSVAELANALFHPWGTRVQISAREKYDFFFRRFSDRDL